jgi:hypothetical protein
VFCLPTLLFCRFVRIRHSSAAAIHPAPGLRRRDAGRDWGGVIRMPFSVILLLMVIGNPVLLPVSAFANITSYLGASILDAGSARKALRQAVVERGETYQPA